MISSSEKPDLSGDANESRRAGDDTLPQHLSSVSNMEYTGILRSQTYIPSVTISYIHTQSVAL